MKPHNKELLANLKWFTQGLTFPDDERGSLNPFIWDVSERGEVPVARSIYSGRLRPPLTTNASSGILSTVTTKFEFI